jgi:hypothetical protein
MVNVDNGLMIQREIVFSKLYNWFAKNLRINYLRVVKVQLTGTNLSCKISFYFSLIFFLDDHETVRNRFFHEAMCHFTICL